MRRADLQHGAAPGDEGGTMFRLWAPSAHSAALLLENAQAQAMQREDGGWYSICYAQAKPGDRYRFLIDGEFEVPDPASHFQPEDVNGPSEIISAEFAWNNAAWKGRPWEEAVIYELHTGSFSPSGDYKGIEEKMDYLVSLGVTAIELMPLADFSGRRGWGYDGVLPYAPDSAYGRPEDLKRLIDAAHAKNLMVFLDVVYNHFGPSGNYLHRYAKPFFTEKTQTPWGAAIDFSQQPVRDFFIGNALYWLRDYHFDGLRFDAVHAISDASSKHFLDELAETVRAELPGRHIHLMLENDKNEAHYLNEAHFTAQWNDDIHHVLHLLLTGESGGYYSDYKANPLARLGRCLTQGFDYQGEASAHRSGERRGEKSAHLPPTAFISFLQNHDQIGNRALGERLSALTSEEKLTLGSAILLLSPQVPMLFMGDEWSATTPFYYFCDFEGELAEAVRSGRRKEFASFPEFANPEMLKKIPDPNAEQTFHSSKLNWQEKETQHERLDFTRKLLELRQHHIIPLLKQGWQRSEYRLIEERGLDCRWYFGGAMLQLIANFSHNPLDYALEPGEHLWGSLTHPLPAWKCSWVISHD